MSEKPEVQLTLGCCAVIALGSMCHWALIRFVWDTTIDPQELDWETVLTASILAIFAAPVVIPVSGFVVVTLLRMAYRSLTFLQPKRENANTSAGSSSPEST